MVFQSLSRWLQELIFFGGNVQTTAIAMAITGSLCCSVIWLVVSLVSGNGEHVSLFTLLARSQEKRKRKRRESMTTATLRRRISRVHRENLIGACGRRKSLSTWSTRSLELEHSVPCMRCGSRPPDFVCRFVLCQSCCSSDPFGHCEQHGSSVLSITPAARHKHHLRPFALDLSHRCLYQCPDDMGFLGAQLISLNLAYNQIHMLPAEITTLTGLQQLCLAHNSIKILPRHMGRLQRLESLDVQHNDLLEVPSGVCKLKHLRILHLSHNCLSELPEEIGQLRSIQEISASNNALTFLPENLGNLHNLKRLYVGENPLSQLPTSIGKLQKLEELNLNMCLLRRLPVALTMCHSLTRIWLALNSLCELPEELGWMPHLEEIHVAHNRIRVLPASIIHLNLHALTVEKNPLVEESEAEVVPSVIPAEKLPSLLELVARAIYNLEVVWRDQELPQILEDMLKRGSHCSDCGGPFFLYHESKLTFQSIAGIPKVPLYRQMCSPHQPKQCSLQTIN